MLEDRRDHHGSTITVLTLRCFQRKSEIEVIFGCDTSEVVAQLFLAFGGVVGRGVLHANLKQMKDIKLWQNPKMSKFEEGC